jgi:uncharacterized protein (DUF1810 family)
VTPVNADPFDLQRFVNAQEQSFARAIAELRAGHKESHWMWYVFPQMRGLGRSPMAQRFGIASLAEARAYLAHLVLGPRLRQCAEAVMDIHGASAFDIFGSPDDLKLHSSATLFARASSPGSVFERLLEKYFDGEEDSATLRLLEQAT